MAVAFWYSCVGRDLGSRWGVERRVCFLVPPRRWFAVQAECLLLRWLRLRSRALQLPWPRC